MPIPPIPEEKKSPWTYDADAYKAAINGEQIMVNPASNYIIEPDASQTPAARWAKYRQAQTQELAAIHHIPQPDYSHTPLLQGITLGTLEGFDLSGSLMQYCDLSSATWDEHTNLRNTKIDEASLATAPNSFKEFYRGQNRNGPVLTL